MLRSVVCQNYVYRSEQDPLRHLMLPRHKSGQLRVDDSETFGQSFVATYYFGGGSQQFGGSWMHRC